MSRNYGIGTRDIESAGHIVLKKALQRRELSFSSVTTIFDRWQKFVRFVKGEGIGRLEKIDTALGSVHNQANQTNAHAR